MEAGVLEGALARLLKTRGRMKASKAINKVCKKLEKKGRAVDKAAAQAALGELLKRRSGGPDLADGNCLILGQPQQQPPQPQQQPSQKQQQHPARAAAPPAETRGGGGERQEAAGAAQPPSAEARAAGKKRVRGQQQQPAQQQEHAQAQAEQGEGRKSKKAKRQQEQEQEQQAHAEKGEGKKRKKAKQQRQQEEEQQGEEGQPAGEGSKRKKAKQRRRAGGGRAAEAPSPARSGGAASSGSASGDDGGGGGASDLDAAGGGEPAEATWRADYAREDVRHGRFSEGEKEKLQRAVAGYAATHGLSTSDYSWLLQRTAGRKGRPPAAGAGDKGPVAEVAAALPQRTRKAVFAALQRMYGEGRGKGAWTPEEDAHLRAAVGSKGPRWKEIGGAIGRSGEQCRDRWRKIGLGDARVTGPWGEEERQRLEELVMEYILLSGGGGGGAAAAAGGAAPRPTIKTGGRTDGRQVLDNVDWDLISSRMGTRNGLQCMEQWYARGPSMVARGEWDPKEDRLLVRALLQGGVSEERAADWAGAVPGRSEAQALKRWRLMLKALPAEVRTDFGRAVHEAALRIWGPQRLAAAAAQQQQQQQQSGGGGASEGGEGGGSDGGGGKGSETESM
ncbi:MAG: hypothetical protein J3K34DRAFT_516817 [Monoraphidium minutum]|nr:MAG: hypothetical protein J3K34DRAFT_516817 [Monoraphidium minutum]